MLVILEGCDGTGKSTIAEHLKAILPNAEIIHCTAETPNGYDFFEDIISAAEHRNIIADRFCYGQFVYQAESDRKLNQRELQLLEAHMLHSGAKIIHVTAPLEEIAQRLSERGETTEKSVAEIVQGFNTVLGKALITPHVWNTAGGNIL